MPVGDIKGKKISRKNMKTEANYKPWRANQKAFTGC